MLPPDKRRAIIAVWDFCRAVDDAADLPGGDPDVALAAWRAEIAACFEDGRPRTPQGSALAPLVKKYSLPRAAFETLVDGVEMDVQPRRFNTFDELYEYCYRVASTVGLICIEVFGYQDSATRAYAVDLGIALQLTNIIRDVASDAAQGRLYLPLDDLERFGCSERDVMDGVLADRVVRLLRFECARAQDYYARASAGLPRGDRRQLVAAEIMRSIYAAILHRIELRGYDVYSQVVRVPRPARAVIAATTWMRTLL